MSRSAAVRAAAAKAISAVLNEGRSLDQARADTAKLLDVGAHALHAELSFGTVRHFRAIRFLLGELMSKPLPRREGVANALLMAAVYELWQMRTPTHAVVSESVNAMRRLRRPKLTKLVNAVLRRFDRERDALLAALDAENTATRTSHPDWLARQFADDWPQQAADLMATNNARAPMWLRVNAMHTDVEEYRLRLAEADIEATSVSGAPQALRLAQPVSVTQLPGFADGHVSVQDVSPQRVAPLCGITPGMRVLDACSAPGGKSAHLLELADGNLDLTALDIDATRLQRVRETFDRLGFDARCLVADASRPELWWNGELFDCVVVDAPCSATGVIRRHPDIKALRRHDDIAQLVDRQMSMLTALAPLVAPEGCLVYATCSTLKAENEAVIAEFTAQSPDFSVDHTLRPGNISGLMEAGSLGYQYLPEIDGGDGFFIARLSRNAADERQ